MSRTKKHPVCQTCDVLVAPCSEFVCLEPYYCSRGNDEVSGKTHLNFTCPSMSQMTYPSTPGWTLILSKVSSTSDYKNDRRETEVVAGNTGVYEEPLRRPTASRPANIPKRQIYLHYAPAPSQPSEAINSLWNEGSLNKGTLFPRT